MIRVVYDYRAFTMMRYGGIPRYFTELVGRIAVQEGFEAKVVAPFYINKNLRAIDPAAVLGLPIPQVPRLGRVIQLLNDVLARPAVRWIAPDLVHETYYAARAIGPRVKRIVTVFDMIHERLPQFFSPRDDISKAKVASVKRAAHVICISESTKKDLVDIMHVEPTRISVIPLSTSINVAFDTPLSKEPGDPYILHVGGRGGYKNFQRLLIAYGTSRILRENWKLVCFGDGPFSADELVQIRRLGIDESRVQQVSGDDVVLERLYRQAAIFVFPSLYEGFGIPLLEAMACGCPVACSDASSFPEVAGDAAYYFDPNDTDSIRATLESVLSSDMELRALAGRGVTRARQFSWEKCALETARVYKSVVG